MLVRRRGQQSAHQVKPARIAGFQSCHLCQGPELNDQQNGDKNHPETAGLPRRQQPTA